MISNETQYDNQQLAQLQNELKDNQLYSGIGIIPGTDIGGGSEGGENGTVNPPTNSGGQTNQGGTNTNTGGDNQNQNATVRPSENQNPGGGTIIGGKTDEDPKFYVVSGEEIAASFYQSDVTIQIFTNDRTKRIKYILTTTVDAITNELYPSGLVRELDIENGGTLTFTKDGEYTITAYAYDTVGNKSNPTIMWFKRQTEGSTTGGIMVSIASGKEGNTVETEEGPKKWYTSNVTLRVLGTDTGSSEVRYRVQGKATSTGQIGDIEVLEPGIVDTEELKIANGTTFRIMADGEFSITAYSYDAGGMRLSSSEVLKLNKDATRPTVQSFTGEQIPGQGFKVKINAVDKGSGLTSNAYTYRHKESTSLEEYISSTPTGTAENLYTGLDQTKTYDMYVQLVDQAGNIAITDVIAKPSLWVSNNPTAGETTAEGGRSYYRSDTIEMKFRGQDSNNVDIMKTTYQVLGKADKAGSILENAVTVGQELPTDEYQLGDKETRTIQLQADGNWTVKVHNYNKEGKLVTTNTIEVTRDITAPEITSFTIGTITFGSTGNGTGTVGSVKDITSGIASEGGYIFYQGTTAKMEQSGNTYEYTGIDADNSPTKVVVKDKAGNTSKMVPKISQINFDYVGQAQSIMLPAGKYKLEVWGAQGGTQSKSGKTYDGGKGGYSCGVGAFRESEELCVYVGGAGVGGSQNCHGGFNGGGSGVSSSTGNNAAGGGGASDMRIGSELLARIIVAGGGGGGNVGSDWVGNGGYGGGLIGGGSQNSSGGSQNGPGSNGTLGTGGSRNYGGGGGGGFYGGGAVSCSGGGGGSGYVLTESSVKPSGFILDSKYYLSNAQTIAGNQLFPAPGGGNETGHSGNGYARITLVE